MTATQAQLTPDEIVERGKALYEKSIHTLVEESNFGKLLMIDVTTGNWVVGEDRIEMGRRLRARNPETLNFGMRLGYPTAEKIGAWPLSRTTPGEQPE